MEDISLKQVTVADPEYKEVYELREEVLRIPLGLSLKNEDLSGDKDETILVAIHDAKVIGCLMLHHVDADKIKFRQMAVSNEWQGKKIGRKLMQYGEALSKQNGYKQVVLHARVSAQDFYTKENFTTDGALFTEVGIDHVVMKKSL